MAWNTTKYYSKKMQRLIKKEQSNQKIIAEVTSKFDQVYALLAAHELKEKGTITGYELKDYGEKAFMILYLKEE